MPLINTMLGPVDDSDLGICLPAERIVDDPGEAYCRTPGNRAIIREWAVREFEDLVSQGARSLIEITPIGCGRDIGLLRDLQETTGLRIVAATGIGPPLSRPDWVLDRKPKRAAEVLVRELTVGIEETGSCAGVISLAAGDAREEDERLFKVIGIAHEQTGAPVVAATTGSRSDLVDALERGGVPAHCVVVCQAGVGATAEELTALAGRGTSLVFANWGIAQRVSDTDLVGVMRQVAGAGLADRIMISVGFGWRIPGPEAIEWPMYGVPGRTYAYLFRSVLPVLRAADFSEGDLWQIMVANPSAFLAHGAQDEESCRFCAHH